MRTRLSFAALALALLSAVPAFAAITGTLMTPDGQPVAGAKVSIYAFESPAARAARWLSQNTTRTPLASADSDSKGHFTIASPKEATVDLVVNATGYAPLERSTERDEDLGALPLRRVESRQGTVRANGKPVAGATVIWSSESAEVIAKTNAEGGYSVPDPTRWASRLTILHPDYAPLEEPIRGDRVAFDRTLVAGRAYSGKVVAADGTTPVAGVSIEADDWPVAKSGDDGSFTIAHLKPNWTRIEAHSGNLLAVRAGSDSATTFKLAKSATILGNVSDGKTQSAVAGATIALSPEARFVAASSLEVQTDAKGNYSFNGIAPGRYRVTVSHPSYATAMSSAAASAGQSVTKSLTVAPLARISGVVVDEQKQPVAAAAVRTETNEDPMMRMGPGRMFPQQRTLSGPDGRFTTKTESEGNVTMIAVKKGYPEARSETLKIAAAERKSGVVLTIPRGFAVSGRVTDKDERPLSGISVRAAESQGGAAGMMIRRTVILGGPRDDEDDMLVKTASDGTYTVRVKEGSYDVTFRGSGYAAKTVPNVAVANDGKTVDATLEPSVEITGRVTRNGVGVEGVNVFGFGGGEMVRPVSTGPDGSFSLTDLSPGTLRVNFTKQDDFIEQSRNLTAPARDVVIELPAGGRVTGRVVDKNTKQPLTSFSAGISMSRGGGGMMMISPPQMKNFTSDDGSFTLDNVPAGPMTIMASAPGYVTARVPNITVEEGKTVSNVEVPLDSGSRIVGRVTGPNGAALSGVTVRQSGNDPLARAARFMGDGGATTDASGEFAIEAVEPGQKTLEFSHPKYLDAEKTVNVTGREVRVDMQLSSGMDVRGVVVTEGGVPVSDAIVSASSGTGTFQRARSDANGAFDLSSMSPGRYTFEAEKAGLASASLQDFDISSGGTVRLVMSAGATIYGHVSGLSAAELNDAVVEARAPSTSATARVDSAGNYRIEGAPSGTVRVVATARTFPERKSSAPQSITLEAGGSRQVDIDFRGDVVIRGRVTRNGRPAGGVTVMFGPRAGTMQSNASTGADEAGNYTIAGLEDGEYNVQVIDMQRFAPYRTTYTVSGSATFDIDMKVATVRGHVTDSGTGEAVEGARVQLRPAATDVPFMPLTGVTDAAGMYLFDSVAPGRYTATADKEGFGNQTLDTTIGDEGRDDLDFRIARNDGLTLTVVDARDNRQLNASAFVLDANGAIVYDDMFRFGGAASDVRLPLAPGSYRVVLTAMGYATRIINATSPDKMTVGLTPGGTLVIRSGVSAPRRARLLDSSGQAYFRNGSRQPFFAIDAAPAATTVQQIAPGTYTLQIVSNNGAPIDAKQVTVVEGQTTTVDW
ncbi:MAG TPA: carboxypeptidase-like regulatory domain-containing protein [Thermoanaerobaculia bacterium]|nr:carboxypeptidase-like regulatory domain-containing protein [Thermoanaerobaculia bacterium]